MWQTHAPTMPGVVDLRLSVPHVRAVAGPAKKPAIDERAKDIEALWFVQAPETLDLGGRQPQSGTLEILALDLLRERAASRQFDNLTQNGVTAPRRVDRRVRRRPEIAVRTDVDEAPRGSVLRSKSQPG